MILLPEDEPPARGIGAMLWLRLALTAVLFGVLVWLVAVAARGWPFVVVCAIAGWLVAWPGS